MPNPNNNQLLPNQSTQASSQSLIHEDLMGSLTRIDTSYLSNAQSSSQQSKNYTKYAQKSSFNNQNHSTTPPQKSLNRSAARTMSLSSKIKLTSKTITLTVQKNNANKYTK